MKKYLLPILIAGAGAVIFFTMKGKGKDKVTKEDIDENEELKTTPKPKSKSKSKFKSLDVNSVIDKISKGVALVKKYKGKKKSKNTSIPSPYQPKPKAPIKFF